MRKSTRRKLQQRRKEAALEDQCTDRAREIMRSLRELPLEEQGRWLAANIQDALARNTETRTFEAVAQSAQDLSRKIWAPLRKQCEDDNLSELVVILSLYQTLMAVTAARLVMINDLYPAVQPEPEMVL